MFNYGDDPEQISPFLLLDYGGPAEFDPSEIKKGVGEHPHRGFETVSLVFAGEVEHRDSGGNAGKVGPGDVQWMTAGSGVVHEEMHSESYTKSGGTFEMIQLWVNLPQEHKMTEPRYQEILSDQIPTAQLEGGTARVIAGELNGVNGPAETFTPIAVWQLSLDKGADLSLGIPEGWPVQVMVRSGGLELDGQTVGEAEIVQFTRDGNSVSLRASEATEAVLLAGAPIDEPVYGHGPFVMNTREEIYQAIQDFQSGKMGRLS
jgi:redox-sensitive bicupin YhaK (pirin superfamily)